MRRISSLAAFLSVAACVSYDDYGQERMEAWLGQPASLAFATWGEPDRTVDLDDGGRTYIWLSTGTTSAVCRESLRVDSDGVVQAWYRSGCS